MLGLGLASSHAPAIFCPKEVWPKAYRTNMPDYMLNSQPHTAALETPEVIEGYIKPINAAFAAFGINPSFYRSLPYDPLRDFAFISIATQADYVLVVNPKLPAKTFVDLVQLAKSEPGKINYASIGIGSMFQLDIERMKAYSHIDLTHVAYKGAGPAIAAVVAGESQVTIASPAGVIGYIKDGRLRPLAVGAAKRLPILPGVPTMGEVGAGEDTLVPTYFGFAAPAGTPQPIVMRLNAEIKRIVHQPDVADRFATAGLDPVGGTPEEFAAEVKRDVQRFGGLVKALGLHAE